MKIFSHIFFWKFFWFAFDTYVYNPCEINFWECCGVGNQVSQFSIWTPKHRGTIYKRKSFHRCSAVLTLSSWICLSVHESVSGTSGTQICLLLHKNHSLNYCNITISLDVLQNRLPYLFLFKSVLVLHCILYFHKIFASAVVLFF